MMQIMIGIGINTGSVSVGDASSSPFKATFSGGNSVPLKLPLVATGTYDFHVDWGDGSAIAHITAYNDAAATHTYANDNPYQISITGIMTQWSFAVVTQSAASPFTIDNWGSIVWGPTMSGAFRGCTSFDSVTSPGMGSGHFSATTNWDSAFRDDLGLTAIYSLDLSSATDLTNIFQGSGLEILHATGIAVNLDLSGLAFSAANLNIVFTNLATVVGKTITITGNPGAGTCNQSIATSKGWSVVN